MNAALTRLGQDILTELRDTPPSWLKDIRQITRVERGDDENQVVDAISFSMGGNWVYNLTPDFILNAMREIVRVNLLGPAAQALITNALTNENYANLDDSERLVSDIAQIAAFGRVTHL